MTVVTRIPPSPTGRFHIGTARTALFNYLFARHAGGKVVFRSEDTDEARSRPEYEAEIIEGLHWLGISWDSPIFRQSERATRYRELLEKLIGEGKAYISAEPSKEDPAKTIELVRLKNPGTSVTFSDLIRGNITFDTSELGDFIIARSLDDALYHFAVVADDLDAGVTHVIRGEDHISNTPRQILIQEALGTPRPAYAHLPLIVDAKRAKLSKRSGATSVMDYKEEGILPEALVNYLALLGWNPGDEREYFSLTDLIDAFSLERVQKSSAAWDREKLLSVNQHWMRALPDDAFLAYMLDLGGRTSDVRPPRSYIDDERMKKTVPLLKERARTFGEAKALLDGELSCLFNAPSPSQEQLLAKESADRPGTAKNGLQGLLQLVGGLPEDVSPEAVKEAVMPFADAEEAKGKGGRGAVLWPLRYALSGQDRSPDPFTLIHILGPAEAASRIRTALGILGE